LALQAQGWDGRPFLPDAGSDATHQYAHDDSAIFTIFFQAIH